MSTGQKIFSYGLLLLLGFLTVKAVVVGDFLFLHYVDLMFHEAGHMIFMFFGEFVQFLGGTIMQLLVPIICGIAFLRQKDYFAAAVMLWWLGENFWDVSIYIADARLQALSLIGGEHDWHYILGKMDLLAADQRIAMFIYGIGITLMVSALVLGVVAIQKAGPKENRGEKEKFEKFLKQTKE